MQVSEQKAKGDAGGNKVWDERKGGMKWKKRRADGVRQERKHMQG